MSEDRVEQFKQEMESMQVRDPSQGRDRLWLRVSVGLMVVGLIVAIAAYPLAATGNSLEQGQAIVQAILGLTAAVVGGALFIRFSFGNFLRFWLARLSYEQQQAADRIAGGR
jgi:uncharacterized membrane protein YeaQ/YmgE (transglycosylase-associated protein family)